MVDGLKLDVIEGLCVPLGERLWRTARDEPSAPHLIFADLRSGTRRVSEQEARVLMCVLLEELEQNYSIETPTAETYQQSGSYALSARTDLTIHGSRRSADRVLSVEFKAGAAPVEVIRKDLEKLTREGVPGLWFHTLEKATPRILDTLIDHMREAWAQLADHSVAANHTIRFVVCALEPAVMFSALLTLGSDVDARLDATFAAGLTEWELHGPDAAQWPPVEASRSLRDPSEQAARDRRGRERWLIDCPQISPRLLYFNRQGDSYRLRDYTRDTDGLVACRTFLAAHPETGSPIDNSGEFLSLFKPALVHDVYDDAHVVTKVDYWFERITALSR